MNHVVTGDNMQESNTWHD